MIAYVDQDKESVAAGLGYFSGFLRVFNEDQSYIATVVGPNDGKSVEFHGKSWAPDSRHIAYGVLTGHQIEPHNIEVMDICTGNSHLLVESADTWTPLAWRPLP